jgi:hypothetical protein
VTRVRVNESASDWVPKQAAVDLGAMGLTDLMDEFETKMLEAKKLVARCEEIKEQMKRFGSDFEILVNGEKKWRVRSDGAFMPKQFAKQYPDYYQDYTVKVLKDAFDIEAFKAAMPTLYESFRAQRLEKINE